MISMTLFLPPSTSGILISPKQPCARTSNPFAQTFPNFFNNRGLSHFLKMACNAPTKCLNVRPHSALRSVGIMITDGGKNGFVLLLEAQVVVRRGKRDKPKA